ncbi:hypothetical protein QUF90_26775 [Desulfococcaceae bacterium HSG9]|nr:hypothetical protein [Desulfococcaceae bacterium HSG9]
MRASAYNALMRLVDSAEAQDSILIYFAGHGDINRRLKSGWWIPSDAISGKPRTYLDNSLVQRGGMKVCQCVWSAVHQKALKHPLSLISSFVVCWQSFLPTMSKPC